METRPTRNLPFDIVFPVGGSESHLCYQLSPSSSLLLSPPLLIPLSHHTGSTYSTTPERREWEEKGYYDSEERKEREREKRRADRVLRKSLLSAANEIKLLKEENGAVKEQRDLMEDEQRQMRKFEEELKVKGELLKGETRKRQARTKVHMDRLPLLTKAEEEIRRNDQQ
ncbi:hypothetical protein Q8A73_018624 [Channa argus]|nr:hypothetical protein Q8A73_018624 [Channa argus]